jgi:regulator of RNase E activity RraA
MSIDSYKKEVSMMNLDKLTEERQRIPDTSFPITDTELLERYEQLYTGAISDVLREFCLLEQSLPSHLRPLRDEDTVAGFAFTVKSAPNTRIEGEMEYRTQMLGEMTPNAFMVWDTTQDEKATLWGGVMTATAKQMGVRAACIDGGIRDTKQILGANFPVYYKHRIPNGSLGRCLITHYQIPIKIGDCFIRPGDLLFADIDGVLCVPREIAYDVLIRAEEIHENENKIFEWVHSGESINEIVEKGGYF